MCWWEHFRAGAVLFLPTAIVSNANSFTIQGSNIIYALIVCLCVCGWRDPAATTAAAQLIILYNSFAFCLSLTTGSSDPCLTDRSLHPPCGLIPPVWVSVQPAVDWSALIEGFARWFSGLAPPPPGAGVRSQQPVVPCAPPSPSLHNRAHAQGESRRHTTRRYFKLV